MYPPVEKIFLIFLRFNIKKDLNVKKKILIKFNGKKKILFSFGVLMISN